MALVCFDSGDGERWQKGEYFLAQDGHVYTGNAVQYPGEHGRTFELFEAEEVETVRLATLEKSRDGPNDLVLLFRRTEEPDRVLVFPQRQR